MKNKLLYTIISCLVIIGISIPISFYYLYLQNPENSGNEVELEFSLTLDKEVYAINETINVTVSLSNVGNISVKVSEIELGLSRNPPIDFEIVTPEGYIINYTEPYAKNYPQGIEIQPDETYTYTCNITWDLWSFGNEQISYYDFQTTGNYTIKAIYRSNPNYCWDNTVWDGTLYSNTLTFTITSE